MSAKVAELEATLRDSKVEALVVRDPEGNWGVVLPEYLSEFSRDEELQKMLIAGDVARSVPALAQGAELAELVKVLANAATDAAVVLDPATNEPVGVVTKQALAMALLEWYSKRPKALSGAPRRSGRPDPMPRY
jgi:CBS domain-containing protein